ncbi:hypothetical protein GW765_00275 [Candidatus Parcubacteria bacterium]|nr:hypothetical protein [Candidatus Parcubacteria bacterium]
MINLQSQQSKKEIARQYHMRVVSVVFFLIASFLVLSFALLLPSYFIALEKENAVKSFVEEIQSGEEFQKNKELNTLLGDTKLRLDVFGNLDKSFVSESIIKPLLDEVYIQNNKIKLNYIKYSSESRSLGIRGVSASRDSLIDFVETIQKNDRFSNVEVPVSSFVQNTNIIFEMTMDINEDSL